MVEQSGDHEVGRSILVSVFAANCRGAPEPLNGTT
jgi:hypothetical protein